jgi:hypothetical protein
MATPVTYVGIQYNVPAYQDTGYAQGAGNLSSYLIALATGSLTLSGGSFPLTADADFGANFGLKSAYYKSRAANVSSTGILRLGNAQTIAWRNNGNTDNLTMLVNSSDIFTFNGPAQVIGGNANSFKVDNTGEQFTEIDLANNGVTKTSWIWDNTGGYSIFNGNISFADDHFGFGVPPLGYIGVRFTNNFTSDGAASFVAGLDIDPTMVGASGDTLYQTYVNVAGFGITTQATDTVASVSSVRIAEPQITVGAGGTVTVAASLLVENAPTEGGINAAIYIGSGTLNLAPTSNQIIFGATRTVTLTVPTPASASRTVTLPDLGGNYDVVGTLATQSIAGAKTFTTQLIGAGTATNDNAAAGYIGERITSSVSNQAVGTSGQYSDITSITLTAGDWDIDCVAWFNPNGATMTTIEFGIGTASGNSGTGLSSGNTSNNIPLPTASGNTVGASIPGVRASLTGSTTYYLKQFLAYTVATPNVSGRITARRIR